MCLAVEALSSWMATNRLLLNPSKTQFIWLGGRRQLEGIDLSQLAQLFPDITFSLTVRDLGVTLDSELSLSQHVNLVTRSCYYQLRQLRVVARSLSHDAVVVLVHAFITGCIDHCCSLLVGLPLRSWDDLIGFFDRQLGLLRISQNLPPFLLTCAMSCIGSLLHNGSPIVLLLWYLVVFWAVLHLTFVISVIQCLMS